MQETTQEQNKITNLLPFRSLPILSKEKSVTCHLPWILPLNDIKNSYKSLYIGNHWPNLLGQSPSCFQKIILVRDELQLFLKLNDPSVRPDALTSSDFITTNLLFGAVGDRRELWRQETGRELWGQETVTVISISTCIHFTAIFLKTKLISQFKIARIINVLLMV